MYQIIHVKLIDDAFLPAHLVHIENHPFSLLLYHSEALLQQPGLVTTFGTEDISKRVGRVNPHQYMVLFIPLSFGECQMMLTGQLVFKRMKDRKSTRLNSSHVAISYAVFCLKKKTI